MTRRELNLAIYEGKAKGVLWQPRLETWIEHHRAHNTMPARFRNMNSLEIYDALGCSPRYGEDYSLLGKCGMEWYQVPDGITRKEERTGNHTIEIIQTPEGELRTVFRDVWEQGRRVNHRIEEFAITTGQGLRALAYMVDRMHVRVNRASYDAAVKAVGDRAEPTMGVSGSGFTELIKRWAGLVGAYYLIADYPEEVELYLEAADRKEDRAIDAALQLPCRIFNFGDHATNEFTPPPILKKYMIPRWQKTAKRLHKEGRFFHSHWDGHSRLIIPFLQETGMDAVEALTPAPMGDMTLEQIKDAVQDKLVVLDLLSVIEFLPNASTKSLLEFTRKAVDMFAPKLILGISDELSAVGEIEKVEAVTEFLDKTYGLPK